MKPKTLYGRQVVRRVFCLAACSLLLAGCDQPTDPDNSGNNTAPYVAGLKEITRSGNDSAIRRRAYYELANDITVTDWTPLGTSAAPFMGAFDGNGHTITITGSGGLFAYTKNATIWDLNIAGTITATGEAAVQAGGIVGNAAWTHITNCHSTASVTVTAGDHNSSAGGIADNIRDRSMVASCTASGNITLNTAGSQSLMIYAGGLVGYAGTGANGDGTSGCLIVKSSFSATVKATGGYPYAGGLLGYNYAKAWVAESSASGAVTAEGENLPYAGGLVGYNSRAARISDSYSTATVNATAESKQALAGGVAGANGANGIITRCYATGAVTATITGDGTDDMGGSLGVPAAANAGGIAGAVYFEAPALENCAALNSTVSAVDSASDGGTLKAYRIAGKVDGALTNNIANSGMTVTGGTQADNTANGQDGADTTDKPAQGVFQTLGWDFTTIWQMGGNGYPIFK
jgi:hypothetical protein